MFVHTFKITASINLIGQMEKLTGQMPKLARKCPMTDCYYEHCICIYSHFIIIVIMFICRAMKGFLQYIIVRKKLKIPVTTYVRMC